VHIYTAEIDEQVAAETSKRRLALLLNLHMTHSRGILSVERFQVENGDNRLSTETRALRLVGGQFWEITDSLGEWTSITDKGAEPDMTYDLYRLFLGTVKMHLLAPCYLKSLPSNEEVKAYTLGSVDELDDFPILEEAEMKGYEREMRKAVNVGNGSNNEDSHVVPPSKAKAVTNAFNADLVALL
jgi:hypothetical protein